MRANNGILFLIVSLFTWFSFSQEVLPVHQDYLSDNLYLAHPAAAGIGETGKIRAAVRMQGFGVANTPQIQTLNFHGKFSELSKAAFGLALVNNSSNTSFSQQALQLTYAYHLDIDKTDNFEQLSMAFSLSGNSTELSNQNFNNGSSIVVLQPIFSLNVDFGAAYHLKGLSLYFTAKNLFASDRATIFSEIEQANLRNYIVGTGYFFGDSDKLQYEPSILVQYKQAIEEKIVDLNFKIYKTFSNALGWVAISYRNSFDSIVFNNSHFLSTIVGLNLDKMMFSYTYSKQLNEIILNPGSFHQISIGIDVLPGELKLPANPNINSVLF